jgi:hypothetical protein
LITDDDNRIATSSVYEKGRGMNRESSGRVLAAYDPLQRPDSFVYGALRERISMPYLVRRTGVFVQIDPSAIDRVRNIAQILGDSAEGEYARAFFYRLHGQRQRSVETLRLAIDQYPSDPDLRQEYLRGYIPALVRGQATPEVAEVAAGLGGPPALLLKAASQGASGDLRSVVSADAGLAEIPWRDAWYPEALEMRVDWRTRVSNPELTRRFGDEALPMIDRMIIMTPTLLLLKVRAEAGLAAQRPSVVVESLSSYVRLSTDMARLGQVRAEALKNDATSVRAFLERAAAMPGADATRIEEVRAEVAAMEAAS